MACGLFKDFLSTTNSLPLIAFVLFAAILTDSLTFAQGNSAPVNVEPNKALLNEGDRTELLCRYGKRLDYCRIEIPGEKAALNLSPQWRKTPGYTYFGAGLEAGQCGVTIERVRADNNGQMICMLGIEGEEVTGTIDLVVAMRPQQPIIELITKSNSQGYFIEQNRFQARCIVSGGRPAPNITWLIDDMPVYNKRVSRIEIEETNRNNLTLTTIKQEIEWELTHEDNGRKLICRSYHQTDRDSLPPQEAAYQLFVNFAPVAQPEQLVYGLYLGHTAMVNVTVNAHPTPNVEWTVDGNVIPQGTSNGRFAAYEPQYVGEDYYNVTLAVGGLTLEDTTKTYLLKASNAFGSREYSVRISSSSTPPSSGLEIGAIVGIVVAVAVLVLIVLLIIFARATGRWCFGGKSIKTQINETTEKDARNHGQQVALLETSNGVTIIGNKHTNGTTSSDANNANNIYAQDRLSVLRRSNPNVDEDDSFEYATDRESSVYNPTTVPIRSVMATAGGRNSQKSASDSEPAEAADLLTRGNQIGIPESRFSRWLPKDQREIIEKQAKLLANRVQAKTPEMERAQRVGVTEKPTEKVTATTPTATRRTGLQETEI